MQVRLSAFGGSHAWVDPLPDYLVPLGVDHVSLALTVKGVLLVVQRRATGVVIALRRCI